MTNNDTATRLFAAFGAVAITMTLFVASFSAPGAPLVSGILV